MNHFLHVLATAAPAERTEPGMLFVAFLGIAIVMIGLSCIILLCMLLGKVCQRVDGKTAGKPSSAPAASAAVQAAPAPIPNKGELVAAVTAALAEELGTDVSAIRVHSFRRIGAPAAPAADPARGELVAAITAALAEELGTDISALRVHSLRRIS